MAAPTGISAQLGFKSEVTYGTAATVDTFHAGFLDESITQDIPRIVSQGLRAGRRVRSLWKPGGTTVGGSVSLELHNQPAASLLTHMFGSVVTTGAGPYTHTATPGDLTGKSLTVEVGRPDSAGTVHSFVYAGSKLESWELGCSVGELAKLTLGVSAQSETSGGTLATASYAAGAAPFVFTEGSVTIAGVEVATVSSATLSASQALNTGRHRLNSAAINEQLESGYRDFTGTVATDFDSLTAYNRFVDGDEAAVVLAFDNGTDSLTVTMNVRFEGDTPTVSGPEMLAQSLPFAVVSSTSDAAGITAVLVNGEASAA